MLGLTRHDFAIRASAFDLTRPWNILRIICGFCLLPHAASKIAAGGLNPGTVGFFAEAGFQPAALFVGLALLTEVVCGVALLLGVATRLAALGAALVLLVAAGALLVVTGSFKWLWNTGGVEYPVFWAITCIAVAMHEFQLRRG